HGRADKPAAASPAAASRGLAAAPAGAAWFAPGRLQQLAAAARPLRAAQTRLVRRPARLPRRPAWPRDTGRTPRPPGSRSALKPLATTPQTATRHQTRRQCRGSNTQRQCLPGQVVVRAAETTRRGTYRETYRDTARERPPAHTGARKDRPSEKINRLTSSSSMCVACGRVAHQALASVDFPAPAGLR